MDNFENISKTQWVRLFDVLILGPLMIYAGKPKKAPGWLKPFAMPLISNLFLAAQFITTQIPSGIWEGMDAAKKWIMV